MFIDILNFSNKTETEFYKEKSGTVKKKKKERKKRYRKRSQLRKFFKYV